MASSTFKYEYVPQTAVTTFAFCLFVLVWLASSPVPEARMGSCHSVASLLADRLSLAAAAGEGDGGPSGTPIYVQ